MKMTSTNNPGSRRGSNSGCVPDASGYQIPSRGNASDRVKNEGISIVDVSLHSMSIGSGCPSGKMSANEIQVQEVEVSAGRLFKIKITEKHLKWLLFLGVFLLLLIGGLYMGFKPSDETETPKQCLTGYYGFPDCIKCECTSDGSTLDCDDTGDCICKLGFTGSKCDKCKEGFTGSKCDECQPKITGKKCNECKPNYFNYPLCQECICSPDGSTSSDCEKDNGKCSCKEGFAGVKCHECLPHVIGDKCDKCEPNYYDYPACYEGGTKVLITTGEPYTDGRNTEIIDLEDSSFSCTKVKQFPVKLYGASGGLMNGQKPFVCGGGAYINNVWTPSKDCYQITEAGSWAKDQTASLDTARGYAGIGSVVINNQLILSGGSDDSIELVSPNTITKDFYVFLPTGFDRHCQVQWDHETFMVIGGAQSRDETLFINVKTNELTNGPSLNIGRSEHACGEIEVNGKSYIIVSGGRIASSDTGLRSTEFLDKNNVQQGWKIGYDSELPFEKYMFQMVSPPRKKALYTVGGHKFNVGDLKDIYKFNCTGGINTCKWIKSNTELGFRHYEFVTISIPNSLADKLCN